MLLLLYTDTNLTSQCKISYVVNGYTLHRLDVFSYQEYRADIYRTMVFHFLWVHHVEKSAICSACHQPVTERIQVEDENAYFQSMSEKNAIRQQHDLIL